VLGGKRQRFIEIAGAGDLQHRAEDFFLIGFHARRHPIEQRAA